MNQHGIATMGFMAAPVFTNNASDYAKAVQRATTNPELVSANGDINRDGSIKNQIRSVNVNALTGAPVNPPNLQLVEMGRDQGHAYGNIGALSVLAQITLQSIEIHAGVNGSITYDILVDMTKPAGSFSEPTHRKYAAAPSGGTLIATGTINASGSFGIKAPTLVPLASANMTGYHDMFIRIRGDGWCGNYDFIKLNYSSSDIREFEQFDYGYGPYSITPQSSASDGAEVDNVRNGAIIAFENINFSNLKTIEVSAGLTNAASYDIYVDMNRPSGDWTDEANRKYATQPSGGRLIATGTFAQSGSYADKITTTVDVSNAGLSGYHSVFIKIRGDGWLGNYDYISLKYGGTSSIEFESLDYGSGPYQLTHTTASAGVEVDNVRNGAIFAFEDINFTGQPRSRSRRPTWMAITVCLSGYAGTAGAATMII